MTSPVPGDLGFSYEFGIDIDLGYPAGPPDWNQIAFITDAGDTNEKATADTATYADRGAARNAITGETWGLTFTHQLQRNTDGTFVEVLAALVEASKFGKRNQAAKVHVRWYDTEGADYAYEGTAYVSRARAAQGNAEVGGFTFTLTGDGPAVEIVNPNIAAAAPTVTAATPTAAPQNAIVKIVGTRFTGATDVKFGAVSAGTQGVGWYVDDDRTIYARMPAGSAGAAAVTVTNSTGVSNALTYTRGA